MWQLRAVEKVLPNSKYNSDLGLKAVAVCEDKQAQTQPREKKSTEIIVNTNRRILQILNVKF